MPHPGLTECGRAHLHLPLLKGEGITQIRDGMKWRFRRASSGGALSQPQPGSNVYPEGVWPQEECFKFWEADWWRGELKALLLIFPILLALHRAVWWHQTPSAPPGTTVIFLAGKGEGSGVGVNHQHPSIPSGLSLHLQPSQGTDLAQK